MSGQVSKSGECGLKIHNAIDFTSLEAHWVTITPQMAAEILEVYNLENRPLKPKMIAKFCDDMKNGRWIITGQTISFRWIDHQKRYQVLCDGQNRLTACVRSGISFVCLVVCGLPAESYKKTDNGKVRSYSDDVSLRGYTNTVVLQGALRAFRNYAPKRLGGRAGNKTSDHKAEELDEILARHPGLVDSVSLTRSQIRPPKGLFPPSVLAAAHYMTSTISSGKALDFASRVMHAIRLEPETPEFALHRRLNDNLSGVSRLPEMILIALYFVAWRAYINGESMKLLRWKTTSRFPDFDPSIE